MPTNRANLFLAEACGLNAKTSAIAAAMTDPFISFEARALACKAAAASLKAVGRNGTLADAYEFLGNSAEPLPAHAPFGDAALEAFATVKQANPILDFIGGALSFIPNSILTSMILAGGAGAGLGALKWNIDQAILGESDKNYILKRRLQKMREFADEVENRLASKGIKSEVITGENSQTNQESFDV